MRPAVLAAIAVLIASTAWAELKPEEVGLIALAGSAELRRLAEHYAEVRGVPKENILLLQTKATDELIREKSDELSREAWESEVRPAIQQWLAKSGREGTIRCLVTCGNVPLKIGRRDLKAPVVAARREFLERARTGRVAQLSGLLQEIDAVASEPSQKSRPEFRPEASFKELSEAYDNSMRAMHERINALKSPEERFRAQRMQENACVAGQGWGIWLQNERRMLSERKEEPKMKAEDLQRLENSVRRSEYVRGRLQGLQEGLGALMGLSESWNRDAQALPLLQSIDGLLGTIQWIDIEPDTLKKNETYASFDSALSLIRWGDYPRLGRQPNLLYYAHDGVPPSMRRTVTMVSRLAAPSLDRAMKLVDTAVATEKAGLTGKVYLDARGMKYDPKTHSRDSFPYYDESLRELKKRLEAHTKLSVVLGDRQEAFQPDSCPDAALYCGRGSTANYVEAFAWRPGAVGYQLGRQEAVTLTTPDSKVWCNAMLERGVCATLGKVYQDPDIGSFPLPEDFFSLLLTGKYTLVETYYRTSPYCGWVLVLVGDPLYNPFRNNPQLAESDLPDRLRPRAPSPGPAKPVPRSLPGRSEPAEDRFRGCPARGA